MNENLDNVYHQAHDWAKEKASGDTRAMIKKFAELLIERSISVMNEKDYHGEWLGEEIKRHFGFNSETKSAQGVEGVLINTIDGKYLFRHYDANHEPNDYLIRHSDLSVKITDNDAYFYKNENDPDYAGYIDYSPKTLGKGIHE